MKPEKVSIKDCDILKDYRITMIFIYLYSSKLIETND